MTTKLYPLTATTFNTGFSRNTNTASANGDTTRGWNICLLSTSPGALMIARTTSTEAGTTAGVEVVVSSIPVEFISDPLAADVTISGTITFNLWMGESATTANCGAQCIIERLDSQLAIASTVVNSEKGTEMPKTSSIAAQNWTAAPTSTAFLRGDRIRVRVLANDAGGTMAASQTFTFDADGPTGAADGDSWIQFTENLTFESSDPTGSQLFLTATSAGINPGSATELEAWTSRGAASTNSVTNTVAGWTTPVQITDTAGGTLIEWYSKPVDAFTLGGKALFNVRAKESNSSANASLWVEIAVCANDGTSPTIWGAAGYGNETIVTADAAYVMYPAGDDTAVSAGQRLRFRIYIDDQASTPIVTGFTETITYSGPTSAAAGDTYVILPQTVTENVAAVKLQHLPRYGQAVNRAASF